MRIERVEAALQWRAVDGWLEPVFYRGKVVGHVRYFSDDLLKFFLRHNKPGKYIEKKEIQVGNTDGKPFVVRSAEPDQVIDWQATVQAEMAPPNDEEDVP